jgi:hypothetical protein
MDLREALVEVLGQAFLGDDVHGVVYGSGRAGRDVDVVVIQPDDPPTATMVVGQLDLCVISRARLKWFLERMDLMFTEPVLTGELFAGDAGSWSQLRDELRARRPDSRCTNHACRRCIEEHLSAVALAERAYSESSPKATTWSLQNLSFSIAYASSASHFARGGPVMTLEEMRASGLLREPAFWEFRDRQKATPPLSELRAWLETWGQALCGVRGLADVPPGTSRLNSSP